MLHRRAVEQTEEGNLAWSKMIIESFKWKTCNFFLFFFFFYYECFFQSLLSFFIRGNGRWLSINVFPTSCQLKLSQSERTVNNNTHCLMGNIVSVAQKLRSTRKCTHCAHIVLTYRLSTIYHRHSFKHKCVLHKHAHTYTHAHSHASRYG